MFCFEGMKCHTGPNQVRVLVFLHLQLFFGQKQFLPETLCLKAYSRDAKPAFLVKDFLFLGTFSAKSCKNVPNSFAMSIILSV
jgi:hypothetical protein